MTRTRSPERAAGGTLALVTYNPAGVLEALFDTVERHLRAHVSWSSTVHPMITRSKPEGGREFVFPLGLDENVGFGRACNRGVSEVREPVTVLMNPDVELLDDSLLDLARKAVRPRHPECLLAPVVLSPDGTRRDTVHPIPASPADLVRALVLPSLFPGRSGVALEPWRAQRLPRVGWAVGLALAARTETLRRLGPFDERVFLYAEDLDLSLRARAGGFETWFWPSARVLHYRAHSTQAAFCGEAFDLLGRSRHEVVERRLGSTRARLDDAAHALTFSPRVVLKPALGRSTARERPQLRAITRLRRSGR